MNIFIPTVFIMLAGFLNGTYAFPVKYMKTWNDESIWLVFSSIAFVLMPWLTLPFIAPEVFSCVIHMAHSILAVLILSGFLFGIGMIVFVFSLRFVGIGISFMLNISSSTVLATLLPILWLDPKKLFSLFGMTEVLALLLFCCAIVLSYFASRRKQGATIDAGGNRSSLGITLGILSGVLTSAQGFAYAFATTNLKAHVSDYTNVTLMDAPWLPLFSAAFIPYFAYFLMRSLQNNTLATIFSRKTYPYVLLCVVMGIFYFGSIIVFSQATSYLGHMGAVIAWPMLMISIILTSNFWSFFHREWKHADKIAMRYLSGSVFSLILAIIVLSMAGILNR